MIWRAAALLVMAYGVFGAVDHVAWLQMSSKTSTMGTPWFGKERGKVKKEKVVTPHHKPRILGLTIYFCPILTCFIGFITLDPSVPSVPFGG